MEFKKLSIADKEIIKPFFADVFTKEPWNDDWSDAAQLDAYITDLCGNVNSLTLALFDGEQMVALSMGYIKHWYRGTNISRIGDYAFAYCNDLADFDIPKGLAKENIGKDAFTGTQIDIESIYAARKI